METEISTFTRRWGNSIAVVIPAKIAEKQKIAENQEIIIKLEKKKPRAGALFGFLKDWKRPTDEILAEADKGWN